MKSIISDNNVEGKRAEGEFNILQATATFASSFLCLCSGLTFGYSAVVLPQLATDDTFPYDESYAMRAMTWIASVSPLSMVIGCLFVGTLMDKLGRKSAHIVLIIPYLIGWITMGFAKNTVHMLIGRFITGLCTGAVRPISIVYIGEITAPKYRAITLFCPSLAMNLGVLISHIMGTFLYWRTASFIFGLPNIISFVLLLFLKESPLWLISNGRKDEGVDSFKCFRGNGEAAEKELKDVLDKQGNKDKLNFQQVTRVMCSKEFLQPFGTIFFLFVAVQFCGVNTLSFYAKDILQRIFSKDIDTFLLMIIIDCIRVSTGVLICLFGKVLPRKITFLVCSFGTTLLLTGLVIYLYISPKDLVWIPIVCMLVYISLASCMVSFSWSFVAEIFPSKIRGLGSGLGSATSFILLFAVVKITPDIMDSYGEAVMYAIYAIVTLISSLILSFILPETNGKSLQEIEDSLNKFDPINTESEREHP